MATTEIIFTQNNDQVAEIKSALRQLKTAMAALDNATDNMLQLIDSGNYTAIESHYGVGSGNGQTLYNLINGANSELAADTNLQALIDRVFT